MKQKNVDGKNNENGKCGMINGADFAGGKKTLMPPEGIAAKNTGEIDLQMVMVFLRTKQRIESEVAVTNLIEAVKNGQDISEILPEIAAVAADPHANPATAYRITVLILPKTLENPKTKEATLSGLLDILITGWQVAAISASSALGHALEKDGVSGAVLATLIQGIKKTKSIARASIVDVLETAIIRGVSDDVRNAMRKELKALLDSEWATVRLKSGDTLWIDTCEKIIKMIDGTIPIPPKSSIELPSGACELDPKEFLKWALDDSVAQITEKERPYPSQYRINNVINLAGSTCQPKKES